MARRYVARLPHWLVGGIFLVVAIRQIGGVPTVQATFDWTQQKVNPDAKTLADFMERVKEYVALHQKLERTLPPLPKEADPKIVDKHQRNLAPRIVAARVGAKQGDIFLPPMQEFIRRHTHRIFAAPEGKTIAAAILDENPVGLKVSVNSRYPDEVPVSTMPPEFLAALPKLPEEIEYRFVGDRLVLLDVHAHLIVDFVEKVLPGVKGP